MTLRPKSVTWLNKTERNCNPDPEYDFNRCLKELMLERYKLYISDICHELTFLCISDGAADIPGRVEISFQYATM